MIRYIAGIVWVLGLSLSLAATPLRAEESVEGEAVPTASMEHRLNLDYLGVTTDGDGASPREYSDLEPGLGFGLQFKGHIGKKHLYIDSTFENDRDYYAEGHLDVNGRFKLNITSERLWHNLEHIPYAPGTPGARADASTSAGTPRVTFTDQNPGDEYGVRVEIDKAEVIAKLGNYPAHLRLKYWRLQKEGQRQQRFGDDGGAACTVCHLQSKTRQVDRLTEEFTGEVDAHLGFFDVTVEQLLRTFRVKDPIPVDDFGVHTRFGGGTFQHSEDPESQLLQSTVTARTSLSGGLIADGAYTYGKRENNSDLAPQPLGVDGVAAESTYQKATGNLSYTPLSALTLNMRYRMLELDTKNSDTVTANYIYGATPGPLTFPVRENMDVNRYEYAASAAWRPAPQLTVKGDFQRETIVRSNTGDAVRFSSATASTALGGIIDPVWELPEEENIDQYRIGLTLRPLKTSALRFNSWYRYQTSDEPAYGISFDDKHEAFLGVNYNNKARWGMTATAKALLEKNENHGETVWRSDGGVYSPVEEYSDREREQQNFDLGLWLNPCSRVTTGINYGYLRAHVVQDLLFGSTDAQIDNGVFDNTQDEVEYLQNSQNYSAYVNVQLLKNLSTRAEGYYVRSVSKFKPNFSTTITDGVTTLPSTSDGLTDISRLDVVQQGLSAGIDWNPAESWTVGLTYGIDDYDARNSDIYDGTVQTCMVSLARTW